MRLFGYHAHHQVLFFLTVTAGLIEIFAHKVERGARCSLRIRPFFLPLLLPRFRLLFLAILDLVNVLITNTNSLTGNGRSWHSESI